MTKEQLDTSEPKREKMASADARNDFEEHEKTYHRFLKLVKYSVIALAILMVILYLWVRP